MASASLDVRVDAAGAQLSSLRHRAYGELLWGAEPIWPQHAPNLFPIVGQLADDTLLHRGERYPMGRHGFARKREFRWIERKADACALALEDDADTRKQYPFAFRFEIRYAVTAEALDVTYSVFNTGRETLPASVGAHPAFRWPLVEGNAKERYTLDFSQPEPGPVRRLQSGLLEAREYASPIQGRSLHLSDSLFEADALIWLDPVSTSVRYAASDATPGAPAIEVSWQGFRDLGVWSKPGAAFLCIEPWYGYASPIDFTGDFDTKPGLLHIPPGQSDTLGIRVSVK
ncbi:MAG: aldose 1-epimerase family protein [Candidatus Eremiobacteraeota bacterium]|nr:aldose 1-epimerase family protein [Candidatus Eremiobacteraeota bacterium]